MEPWVKVSLLLCVYGVVKEFRPLEPFVTKFLNSPPMNFTIEEISVQLYPVSIYASMLLLVIMFLITDMVRYKPIIIVNSLAGITVYILLTTCRTIFAIQVAEFAYGFFNACEAAYYSYIYAKVDKEHYQEVSGFTRAAYLTGRAISGISSQILITVAGLSYFSLNYFTLGGMFMSLIWAILLPPVSKSLYFHRDDKDDIEDGSTSSSIKYPDSKAKRTRVFIARGCVRIWNDFTIYTNFYVVKWSLWYAITTCGYYQILTYVQPLWEEIIDENKITDHSMNLNGVVEAVYTLLSALAVYLCGKINLPWAKYGELFLLLGSLTITALLFIMSQTNSMWLAYATYILYAVTHNGTITIASSEIAKNVNMDSHGLVFGFNLFVGFILQSFLTFIVVDQLEIKIRTQFVIYACCYSVFGVLFVLKWIFSIFIKYAQLCEPKNG